MLRNKKQKNQTKLEWPKKNKQKAQHLKQQTTKQMTLLRFLRRAKTQLIKFLKIKDWMRKEKAKIAKKLSLMMKRKQKKWLWIKLKRIKK